MAYANARRLVHDELNDASSQFSRLVIALFVSPTELTLLCAEKTLKQQFTYLIK